MKFLGIQITPLKFFEFISLILLLLCFSISFGQQKSLGNFILIDKNDTKEEIVWKAANIVPSAKQYEWQKLEFTAFIHFGINTFYEVEWGRKDFSISKFNPTEYDPKQWVSILKNSGIKLILLTTKHHDGFCLWQTKLTDYSIANTPFQNGMGDIVRDLSIECAKEEIKFGIYLSPWDMHEPTYGTDEYNIFFVNQLTELLTKYGEIAEVWFDGACGEGPNGKKQVYDWQSYYKVIRKLQPNAVIAIMGPDARWVGTESGYGRKTEWSVLPGNSFDQQLISSNSQQQKLDEAFIPKDLMNEDLGSRIKILSASSLIWYPAEIDVSIRNGWFYHARDDSTVKSPEKLVDIYFNSVGLNGVLLLNVPPDKRGLIHENDVKALQGMKKILDETFKINLAENASIVTSNVQERISPQNILDNDLDSYWIADENSYKSEIHLSFDQVKSFNCAKLQENILIGQRIEEFHLDYWNGKEWIVFTEGTTVGYKRLLRFPMINTNKVRIVIEQSRLNPTLASFGLYLSP